MKNEGFIKFYNCFMDTGKYKLSPLDWYWYALLASRWNAFLNVAEITINRLTEIQHYYKNKRSAINKGNVKNKVWELQDRGLITILTSDDELIANKKGEFNYDKTIVIAFNNFDGKYEPIHKSLYDKTDDVYENYALCCIHRIEQSNKKNRNKKGFDKSLTAWESLLECSSDTVERTIGSMLDKKLVSREGWNKKQLNNGQYKSTPYEYFIGVQDKVPGTPMNDSTEQQDTEQKIEIEWGNWKNWNARITYEDCLLYHKQIDIPEFKEQCDKRLKKIPEKTMFYINKDMMAAEAKLNEAKMKEQAQQRVREKNEIISIVAKCKGIPLMRDGNVIDFSVNDADKLTLQDTIIRTNKTEDHSFDGGFTGYTTHIEEIPMRGFLSGDYGLGEHDGYIRVSSEIISKLFKQFKDMVLKENQWNQTIYKNKFDQLRNRIKEEVNSDKKYDEDWEFDHWMCYGPNDEENLSKKERMREQRRIEKQQEEKKIIVDDSRPSVNLNNPFDNPLIDEINREYNIG
ncbi:hypothetical protein [Marinicrinis sediminis]|uniref:Uncharacterized protein n=1 Tax=Marinicrinis sediminis TaxID=1652465 RepID=A0ABW5RBC8_9BACL